MQVTSAVLAGMVWALEDPSAGKADEMDYRRCLEVQLPYLGLVSGIYIGMDTAEGSAGVLPGGYRCERSVAVQERAGAVS
jgi:homospermidine synthase